MHSLARRLKLYFCVPRTIKGVLEKNLTYLDKGALFDLYETTKSITNNNLNGLIIEAGCALGGSSIVIACAKEKVQNFYIYDVFDTIPPPSDNDDEDVQERYSIIIDGKAKGIDDQEYYGYQDKLLEKVNDNFTSFGLKPEENNVHFIRGLFQDTINIDEPVALAHIDGDWYDSVMTCLERIAPHLQVGGTLIIDDYYSWSGCKKATDDYFKNKKNEFEFIDKSRLHIKRKELPESQEHNNNET